VYGVDVHVPEAGDEEFSSAVDDARSGRNAHRARRRRHDDTRSAYDDCLTSARNRVARVDDVDMRDGDDVLRHRWCTAEHERDEEERESLAQHEFKGTGG
jgi:hypothetical protein